MTDFDTRLKALELALSRASGRSYSAVVKDAESFYEWLVGDATSSDPAAHHKDVGALWSSVDTSLYYGGRETVWLDAPDGSSGRKETREYRQNLTKRIARLLNEDNAGGSSSSDLAGRLKDTQAELDKTERLVTEVLGQRNQAQRALEAERLRGRKERAKNLRFRTAEEQRDIYRRWCGWSIKSDDEAVNTARPTPAPRWHATQTRQRSVMQKLLEGGWEPYAVDGGLYHLRKFS